MTYLEEKKQVVQKQLKQVILLAGGIAVFGVAVLFWLILSMQIWLGTLAGGLILCAAMFYYLYFGQPFLLYVKRINAMQTDIKHTETYTFLRRSPDVVMREGVAMHMVYFQIDSKQDRLLFWPQDWEFPAITAGTPVAVCFSSHYIITIQECI